MKKSILFSVFVFFYFIGFTQNHNEVADETREYIKKYFQITDFGIIGVADGFYTRTLSIINISGDNKNIRVFSFENEEFVDDGIGFDVRANDGVLTSKIKYKNKPNVSVAPGQTRIVSNILIADSKYSDSPEQKTYNNRRPKIKVTINCDYHTVPCCNCPSDCGACKLGWWPHSCIQLSNCNASVTFEW